MRKQLMPRYWLGYLYPRQSERNNMTEEREGNQEMGDAYHCTAKALEGLCMCWWEQNRIVWISLQQVTSIAVALLSCPVWHDKSHPCSHEEADTRLLLHMSDAVQKGYKKVTIRTVDTDVAVLPLVMFRSQSQRKCGLLLVVEQT